MKQKKDNCKKWGITIILVILICTVIIYINMPKRRCHTQIEKHTDKIILKAWNILQFNHNKKIVCEDGVKFKNYGKRLGIKIYPYARDNNKICLLTYTTKTKVCEIV